MASVKVKVTEQKRGCCNQSNGCCTKCGQCLRDSLLVILLLLGVAGGVALGTCLRLFTHSYSQPDLHPREMMYLYFPAEVFIRFMTFIVIPFMVTSIISGIGSLDASIAGKIGARTLIYYLGTTALAVGEGFVFVYAISPGRKAARSDVINVNATQTSAFAPTEDLEFNRLDSLLDMIRNLFPDNIIKACVELYNTQTSMVNISLANGDLAQVEKLSNVPVDSMNILGLTMHSILFGIGLAFIRERGRVMFAVCDAIFIVLLRILLIALWLYPVALVSMIATSVVQVADPLGLLWQMFIFLLTVFLGLFSHTVFVLPMIYLVLVRKNPYKHMLRCGKALVTAFVTNNSSMTVPVTMQCLSRSGIHSSVVRFMIPIGASVNMDGFALYESVSCIFIATLNGMNPSPVQLLTLGLTAVAVSIGAPTAGSGMVLYIILFKSIGLPLRDIALLLPFDWLLGRFRTTVNVWGDCVGSGIVDKFSTNDLAKLQRRRQQQEESLSHSSGDEDPTIQDPLLTNFTALKKSQDFTLQIENETGDRLVISQV